ncbi:MAG TPA: hypothetical protein VF690_10430 [Hymenobacter sp.]|jgi:hypothetical protein
MDGRYNGVLLGPLRGARSPVAGWEKAIAYAKSYDQALVGSKVLTHWLFNAGIYTH